MLHYNLINLTYISDRTHFISQPRQIIQHSVIFELLGRMRCLGKNRSSLVKVQSFGHVNQVNCLFIESLSSS